MMLVVLLLAMFATNAAAAPSLPDGRVLERVSAEDTQGANPATTLGGHVVPLGDDAVIYGGGPAPLGEGSSGAGSTYLATRGPFEWETSPLVSPSVVGPTDAYGLDDATPDLSSSVWGVGAVLQLGIEPPGGSGFRGLRYRDSAGAFRTIIATPNYSYGGMSRDGASILLTTTAAPVGYANPDGLEHTWLWHPDGRAEEVGAEPGSPLADCAASSPTGYPGISTNAISADGGTVFMESLATPGNPECPPEGRIYVVRDGHTTPVGEPEGGPIPEQPPVLFRGANATGQIAYLSSEAPLNSEDHTPGAHNLYRWDAPAGSQPARITCLTCGPTGSGSREDEVGPASSLISEDGSYFYFLKTEIIGGSPESGFQTETGLYVEHEGAVRRVPGVQERFLSVLGSYGQMNATGDVLALGPYRVVVGPAGIGVDIVAESVMGEPLPARPSELTSQSLIFSGAPRGAGGIAGTAHGAVSDDGDTIVLTSTEVLAPGGVQGEQNVYRWRDGELAYLAPGAGEGSSAAVSGDGDDIFLLSNEQLLPNAAQSAQEIYDARVGGGFPGRPTTPAPCASVLDCRGAASTAPSTPSPAGGGGHGNPPSPVLILRPLDKGDLAEAERSGTLVLRLEAGGGDRVSARVSAKLDGRPKTIAKASRPTTSSPARLRLRLHLDSAARTHLSKLGRLRLRIAVALPGAGSRTANVLLEEKDR